MVNLNPSVHTVEAVRACLRDDQDECYEICEHWLDKANTYDVDTLEAAGILLRDVLGFAAVLARTIAHDDPEKVELLLDAYCIQAMDEAPA